MRANCLAALVLLLSSSASAAVWRVEKDGTGDFKVIQDAVEASAAGDTVLIGPGRYNDRFLVGTPPWQQYTRVLVNRSDLTLIGAGAQLTIIGDDVPLDADHDQDRALVVHDLMGGGSAGISGIGVENVYFGMDVTGATRLNIDSCRFSGNRYSLLASRTAAAVINHVEFASISNEHQVGMHILAIGPGRLSVNGSTFAHSGPSTNSVTHVQLQAMSAAELGWCSFGGGALGIVATIGSGVMDIHNCFLDGQQSLGIRNALAGGTVRIRDTHMRAQNKALQSTTFDSRWEVERLIVDDAAVATLVFLHLGQGHIRDSTLAKGSRYVVEDLNPFTITPSPGLTFDMTNNWWGTSDPDSIQAWIYDGADQPERPYYFIDWSPYRSDPLPMEKKSLGGVKALFR